MKETSRFSGAPTQNRFSMLSPDYLLSKLPSTPGIERRRRRNLSRTLDNTLDRVNVLGNGEDYGHSGCVNALSWAQNGNLLLTAGDDLTVRIWSMDQSDTIQEYPFVCRSVIRTGHRANIFSAKMLPLSSRIATAAGDYQIRVFDAATALHSNPGDTESSYSASQCSLRVLRCHRDSVKKIITEESPDLFLSLSEDGTVRQHDLRTSHICRRTSCPEPLVSIGHQLSTLSLSPLVPYQFIVAGEGDYGYLYDRRHLRRKIEHEWGSVPRLGEEVTTCVRKFGRETTTSNNQFRGEHITGSRMSKSNGHEVILSYSGDGVYLFSTKDEPTIKDSLRASMISSVMPSNTVQSDDESKPMPSKHDEGREQIQHGPGLEGLHGSVADHGLGVTSEENPAIPVIMPRRRYAGVRNVMTVKDVNFLGPDDECVVSGSDDGNFFIWNKESGALKGIYEGDGTVVNVIEGHPHFPLLAVSGIDETVKLFAPTFKPSSFSRIKDAERIMDTNKRLSSTRLPASSRIASLLSNVGIVLPVSEDGDAPECSPQ